MKAFEVRRGAIHLTRLGPVNAQKQTHRNRYTAPVSRGMWAFPYGHDDSFFYFHRWEALLPKRLQSQNIANAEESQERREKLREIQKRVRLKSWWHEGHFYSRITPKGQPPASWYLWNNPKEWAQLAGKKLWTWMRYTPEAPLEKVPVSRDHLEIFIPLTAQALPQSVD